jgi:hypothetical protein
MNVRKHDRTKADKNQQNLHYCRLFLFCILLRKLREGIHLPKTESEFGQEYVYSDVLVHNFLSNCLRYLRMFQIVLHKISLLNPLIFPLMTFKI